jgi:hypothetical protein
LPSRGTRVTVVVKAMRRRDVEAALMRAGCHVISDKGSHTKWGCSCPQKHSANIPRHGEISPGVVRDTIKRMPCQKEGWLQ